MIDVNHAARQLALQSGSLTAVASVYVGDTPPPTWDPAAGLGCVMLKSRGGPVSYDEGLQVSLQARCYGTGRKQDAEDVWRALYDALHNKYDQSVRASHAEVTGQLLQEADTGRFFILAYFQMIIREVA